MRNFFHCDTAIYKKRLKTVLTALLTPLVGVSVFCSANIVYNMRADGDKAFAALMVFIAAGCVAAGMLFCFAGAYIAERKSRFHARYTYFDILPKGLIYSRYGGQHILYGKRTIYRRLYYIPFSNLTLVQRGAKTPYELTITGKIREYFLPTDRLGYHIDESGELIFDSSELSQRHFTLSDKLTISNDFGRTKQLYCSIEFYAEKYKNPPPKKEFNIADHISAKAKKTLRTSNPVFDLPSFDRKW